MTKETCFSILKPSSTVHIALLLVPHLSSQRPSVPVDCSQNSFNKYLPMSQLLYIPNTHLKGLLCMSLNKADKALQWHIYSLREIIMVALVLYEI